MSTTTPPRIPDYIERAMEDAKRVNWKVARRLNSVTLTPHSRHKGIGFSLTKLPTADQVRVQLDKAGLYGALKKLQPEETATALPEPEPEHGMAEAKTDTPEKAGHGCPECQKPFKSPAGLASHRRKAHNVEGTSKATLERRAAKEKKAVPAPRAVSETPFAVPTVEIQAADLNKVAERDILSQAAPEVVEAVEALLHAVTKTAQNGLAPLQKKVDELQAFKDAVEAEVSNGNQGPFQTLANIVKHGGEGFGTPKA
ncbi:hypothetical protein [Streptomyces mirabilis]|uniref:hypothetical protein n=1 Tax=Streptomyces mirabilis TaxID=68239 RepID=UPI00368365C2